jgi:hypothetical protein
MSEYEWTQMMKIMAVRGKARLIWLKFTEFSNACTGYNIRAVVWSLLLNAFVAGSTL